MTDLLLYFTLCFLASLVVCAALARLTRPEKIDKPKELLVPPPEVLRVLETELDRVFGRDNEDTRPIPISMQDITGADDYEGIWGESAITPHGYGESQAQKETIDKWEREALNGAGEDYL